jgi:hypothetical protein
MGADVLLRELDDLALALVGKHFVGFLKGQPHAATYFDAHVFSDVAEAAAAIAEEIEGHDFEDAFASAPGARVNVSDVRELCDAVGFQPGFFANLAFGGLFGLLTFVYASLGKRQDTRLCANGRRRIVAIMVDGIGLDHGYVPFAADATQYDAASGNFSNRLGLGGHARKSESRVKQYVRRVGARAQRCVVVEKTEK